MDEISKWDLRFYKIAESVKTWSKDPTTQVGAVIVKDRRIIATGYNGLPTGILDDNRILNRSWKINVVIHAECNALFNAAKNGNSVEGSSIYVTMFPCSNCSSAIIQSGIKKIICPSEVPERWEENIAISKTLFEEAGVEIYAF